MRNGKRFSFNSTNILNEILITARDESAERAILATIHDTIVNYPEQAPQLIDAIRRYDLKASDFSNDTHKEAFRILKKYLLSTSPEKINDITFKDFLIKENPEIYSLLADLYENDEALPLETFEDVVKIVKEESLRAKAITKALDFLQSKKSVNKLKDHFEDILQEIENLGKHTTQSVEELFLTLEDIENVKVEWIVEDFIPKNAITGITAKFSTGKTTLIYALLKTFVLPKGIPVLYVDLDNPLTVIKKKLEDFGLKEYLQSGQLKILSRHKLGINARHEAWQKVKEWLLEQEHHVVIIDSLKNFAKGYDINSDKEAEFLMSELKDLTSKHTVIYLHHIPKMLNPDMPFKNSGTILDNTDVAFFLETDKAKRISRLKRFKDRIPVKEVIEFVLSEDGTLEKALPEWIREAIQFVKAVFEEVGKGNNKKRSLAKAVAEKLGGGYHKYETLLEQYEGRYWKIEKGEHNAKVIVPTKPLEEVIKDLENKAYAKPVENQELSSHENPENAQPLENQQLSSCPTIYIKEENWTTEEETRAIQEVLEELLEYDEYVDLGTVKVFDPHPENVKEIASDPLLKSILLELYIAHEKGEPKGWEYLIEEVKEGKKPFHQALKEFVDIKDIEF